MNYYPVCLQITARPCLVVGGGRVAERKVKGLLECGAKVLVVSPELTAGLKKLYEEGAISWEQRGYHRDDVAGAFLVMAATNDPLVQDMVLEDAERHNILLNVADVPDKCNFILPALVKRGSLSIAISTAGKSPALAKQMRQRFEEQIGDEFAVLNDIMGAVRLEVLGRNQPQEDNERLFNRLLDVDMPVWIRKGDWQRIKAHFEKVLGPMPKSLTCRMRELVISFAAGG